MVIFEEITENECVNERHSVKIDSLTHTLRDNWETLRDRM